jgi:hypothetical protein
VLGSGSTIYSSSTLISIDRIFDSALTINVDELDVDELFIGKLRNLFADMISVVLYYRHQKRIGFDVLGHLDQNCFAYSKFLDTCKPS